MATNQVQVIRQTTTEQVGPTTVLAPLVPEFGRTADVQRLFGIRRGSLYNLHNEGKVRGCVLRVRGQKSGIRLWDLKSVQDLVRREMGSNGFSGGNR